jgi:hypothetical protein
MAVEREQVVNPIPSLLQVDVDDRRRFRVHCQPIGDDHEGDRRHRVEAPEDIHQSQGPHLRTRDRVPMKVPPADISEVASPH